MNGSGFEIRPVRLAQAAPSRPPETWWPKEGEAAISSYDDLLARVAGVADPDARGEILKWIGRSDMPGSPAERYKVVADALTGGAEPDAALETRVGRLQEIVADLDARVSNAEEAYGTLPAPSGAGGAPGRVNKAMMCVAGGVALLGLVVLPLLAD